MFANDSTAWDYYDGLVFVAHRPGPLVEADFDGYLADMLPRVELRGVVVRGSDGAPKAHQREQIHHWFMQNQRHGAVLTSSVLTRGGVTALRWFGLPIRAYGLSDLDAALSFVGVKTLELGQARQRLQRVIAAADKLQSASVA
jgi:hypothetical protein